MGVLRAFSAQGRGRIFSHLLWVLSGRDKGKMLRETEIFQVNFSACVYVWERGEREVFFNGQGGKEKAI